MMNKNRSLIVGLTLFGLITSCIYYFKIPAGNQAFLPYLGLYTFQFLIFLGSIQLVRMKWVPLSWIVGTALICRLLLLFSDPILENDYWRYLWDGRVLAHGINPYAYSPMSPALDHLDTAYRKLIGFKQYGTIYPPFSILVFALTHLIAGDSLLALKITLTFFDFATGLILIAWLRRSGLDPRWSALYLLNPLALKEVANSGHLDSIAVFFSTLAAYLLWLSTRHKKQSALSLGAWVSLAVAIASKLYPVCFIPLFIKKDINRVRGLATLGAVLFVFYAPFVWVGTQMLNGPTAFAKHWVFNASVYRVFQSLSEIALSAIERFEILSPNSILHFLEEGRLAKIMVGAVFGGFVLYKTYRSKNSSDTLAIELTSILGFLLIVSPVVNAWYVLWVLPFAVLSMNNPWLIFSYLVIASYSWWHSIETAPIYRWVEYISFFLLIFIYRLRNSDSKLAE